MDERNQARVAADARTTVKSVPPTDNSTSKQTKFARWSQNSKFNKILNNIERSILAQFNGSSEHQARQHHSQNNKQSLTSAGQQFATNSSSTAPNSKSKAINATKSANKFSSSTSTEKRSMTPAADAANQAMDRVTSGLKSSNNCSQPMPANKNGKMILNKYQQQIVSAMQTNKNRQAASSSGSSYSHNRLSIPPPHANDEAQSHRLLFGSPRIQPDEVNSTNDQVSSSAIYEQGRASVGIKQSNIVDHHHQQQQQQPPFFYHGAASPASSAQSLPVTKPGFLQAPPYRSQLNALDDEESGFSTYQSRRSALNNPPSQVSINDFSKPSNNMLFMQPSQLGPESFTKNGPNNLAPQQQQHMINHHNLLQSRITQQQSIYNTQQQQQHQQQHLNKVPISQGVMYNNNLNFQLQVNSQQNTNRLSDNRNQNYGSYNHLGPVPSSQAPMQQPPYQPQPQYDGQIYANAPPKPRRYQYYDQSFGVNPHLTNSTITLQNYPPPQQPHPTQFLGQRVIGPPVRQFSYNITSEQAQIYNQRHGQLMNGPQIPYKPQRQLPMLPPPPTTLTKSKSSLDVADMACYTQNRTQADGIQRVQLKSSNVPIYGSTRLINQLESSTLQRNHNYRPQITINYQQQQRHHNQPQAPPTNLQRSKSIGNLLPDTNNHELNITQRQLAPLSTAHHLKQQSLAPVYPKFLTVSSASTNNLNYVGVANNNTMLMNSNAQGSRQASQMMQQTARLDGNSAVNNSIQKQHPQPYSSAQNAPLPPMRQSYQRPVNGGPLWPSQKQNECIAYNNGDGETTKTSANIISNSGKFVRQSQNGNANSNNVPPVEASGFVTQSLDDKIRHLLIGDDSISGAGGANNSNNKSEFCQVTAARPVQQQSQLHISRPAQLSQDEADTHSMPVSGASKSIGSVKQDLTRTTSSNRDEQLVGEQVHQSGAASTSMGNRHQGNYQVNEANLGTQDQQMRVSQRNYGNYCDSISTNSQLIVDLTTPRVLAKTQTTLLPATSLADGLQQFKPQEAWSMNQLGLPTRYTNQFASNAQSDISNKERITDGTNKVDAATDTGNFTAPYYYSDLKSEDQRRALFNIVQQKSLSPPPQLLSRSVDQSATRLGPKSATMHASQARMLSETLAASQRQLLLKGTFPDSKSTNNIPTVTSNSSVIKKIDKLFESPVEPELVQPTSHKLHSAKSMLALSTDLAGEESSSAMSRIASEQTHIESLSNSSGYCSDAWKKASSKSKSLENINQQQQQTYDADGSLEKSTFQEKLRRYENPVYENIRRSDKLLSAINNSTTCLSTSSTRSQKSRSSLPSARVQPSGSFHDLGDDEDDFIEFLSTEGNSSHGQSQFDSSQFSASDFNNSSSSGSTSESSHSGSVTTDSLDISRPTSKSQLSDGPTKRTVSGGGILKSSFKHDDKSTESKQNGNRNHSILDNDIGIQSNKISNNNNSNDRDDSKSKVENKFKNVLGNVIDVDV